MNGVLVADKPAGWTSHDVVAKVKRTLKARKVGHLGTLDPMATGVLPLVINGATRFARFMHGGTKVYRAALRLGAATDTYDSTGTVVATAPTGGIGEAEVACAFESFRGSIKQLPPMYSSVKKGGVPLYKLARKGVVVEREPREVEIFDLRLLRVDLPEVEFTVECSRGTYVRSLCHDVGSALGCGAHMTSLRRIASGAFTEEEAVDPTLDAEALAAKLIPLEEALARDYAGLISLELGSRDAASLTESATVSIEVDEAFFTFLNTVEMVRFVHDGRPIAAAEPIAQAGRAGSWSFKVIKVFAPGLNARGFDKAGLNG